MTRSAATNQSVAPTELTHGHLLAGRVEYAQPALGFRSGIEPVLLAAAVPARPGERALEAGSGAGAALLCLATRVPRIEGLGIERDPSLVAVARRNAEANHASGLSFLAEDITAKAIVGPFDHALANPPYHPHGGTASPSAHQERAKRGHAGLLAGWASALASPLRHRGSLTFILPAASLAECLVAMSQAGCQPAAVLPLWPKQGRAAKLILLQAIKGGRSSLRLLAGLTLHESNGAFTPAAEAILRCGTPLHLS